MDTAALSFDTWHAVDAPFEGFDAWINDVTPGLCTACGHDAWAGRTTWWHADGIRLCPDRGMRIPGFSPDA